VILVLNKLSFPIKLLITNPELENWKLEFLSNNVIPLNKFLVKLG